MFLERRVQFGVIPMHLLSVQTCTLVNRGHIPAFFKVGSRYSLAGVFIIHHVHYFKLGYVEAQKWFNLFDLLLQLLVLELLDTLYYSNMATMCFICDVWKPPFFADIDSLLLFKCMLQSVASGVNTLFRD